MDRGQRETEAILKQIEKRINQEYKQAIDEIEDQLSDYLRRFEIKDKKWQEWVESGYKTEDQYKKWRMQQMAVGEKWSEQKEQIAYELAHVNETAKGLAKMAAPEIFAENANYSTFKIEKDAKIDTGFTLYSRESVAELIANDPEVLPPVGKKVARDIAMGKAVKWNRQQLQSVMMQGILQGDSIPKLATRLANTVGDRDRKAAIRNARTMATAAQNAGREQSYKDAQSKGIELEQMWIATLDSRTRHSHRWLDGERKPVGEPFSNGCRYPADPEGAPSEIYNCRCTLRAVVKGLERRSGQYRDTSAMDGMTYDEWRNAKATSNPITLPEEKGKAIKQSFINEYRGRKTGARATTIADEAPKETRADRIRESGLLNRDYQELTEADYKAMLKESLKNVSSADKKQIAKHKKADGTNGGYVATTNYKVINDAVRKGDIKSLSPDDQATRDALNRAINSYALPQDTKLYRYVHAKYSISDVFGITDKKGQPLGEWDIQAGNRKSLQTIVDALNNQAGKVIPEPSVLSTSVIRDKNVVSYDKRVRMIIEAPEGTKCYLPNNKSESECILGENTELMFKQAYQMPSPDGVGHIIEMVYTIVNEVK